MIKCQTIAMSFLCHSSLVFFRHSTFAAAGRRRGLRYFLLAVMVALKDSIGTEFVECIRVFLSENGPLSKVKIGT